MNLFNIGGEGQLYVGAIVGAAAALALGGTWAPLSIAAMIVAGAAGGAALRADPGRPAGVLLDQRDHHLADAQLRRRARPHLPDLRLAVVLARHLDARRARLPAGQDAARRGDLAGRRTSAGSPSRSASCSPSASRSCVAVLYARTRFGFEVKVIGDSPRAARYAGMRTRRKILAVMALSGAIAGIGGASQDGDFRHLLDPRGLSAGGLRLRRDRDRRARPLQPVRGRARRVPARRAPERGLRAAGRRLPVRPRRRDAGADPLLRARRRAARPLPDPARAPGAAGGPPAPEAAA